MQIGLGGKQKTKLGNFSLPSSRVIVRLKQVVQTDMRELKPKMGELIVKVNLSCSK